MDIEKTAFDNLIDSLNNLLSSNDTSLDQLQEIVDYIKVNREKIENLSIDEISGLQDAINLKVNIADIVDNLTSTLVNAPLSANQGRILEEQIDIIQEAVKSLKVILTSDDTTLDELQEIVNFIKQNRDDLENLDLSNIAETDTLKHFTKVLKNKLDSIEEGANKYIHPSSHAATMIVEDTAHRFVTDTQIDTWNNKANQDTNTWRPISDSVSSTSSTTSASSKAVKAAYDKAVSAYNSSKFTLSPGNIEIPVKLKGTSVYIYDYTQMGGSIKINYDGVITTTMNISLSPNPGLYSIGQARIYINGEAKGTLRTLNYTKQKGTFKENITVKKGDILTLRGKPNLSGLSVLGELALSANQTNELAYFV